MLKRRLMVALTLLALMLSSFPLQRALALGSAGSGVQPALARLSPGFGNPHVKNSTTSTHAGALGAVAQGDPAVLGNASASAPGHSTVGSQAASSSAVAPSTSIVQPGSLAPAVAPGRASGGLSVGSAATLSSALSPQSAIVQPGSLLGALSPTQTLPLAIALKPRNQAALDGFIGDIYDPTSPNYKHFLTPAEFTSRFLDPSARAQVDDFLLSQGLQVHDSGLGTVIDASGTVAQVQQAFHVHIGNYQTSAGTFYASNLTPALPTAIAGLVQGIAGLDNLPAAQPQIMHPTPKPSGSSAAIASNATPQGCSGATGVAGADGAYVPNEFASAYDFTGVGNQGQGQTVALFEGDDYLFSNIQTFATCFGISVSNGSPVAGSVTVQRKPVDGGVAGPSGTDGQSEVELDMETVLGLAPKLAALQVYEAPGTQVGLVDEYQQMANDDGARIISSSWGWCELDYPSTMLEAQNAIFAQFAAQGQSFVEASGDSGSSGCLRSDGSTELAVDGASASPYTTSVGGTSLQLTSGNAISSEGVWNDWSEPDGAGGGGVSTYFAKPSYQTGLGSFSSTMREVPDVSADADPATGYVIYTAVCDDSCTDEWLAIGGTSAATPLWAAGLALVDEYLQNHAQPSVGFANPALYTILNSASYATALHDITAGDNCYVSAISGQSCGSPGSGLYAAGSGYDMASGIGSPNFGLLASTLSGLQSAWRTTTTILGVSATGSVVAGTQVTLTATVSSGATVVTAGTVTFTDHGEPIASCNAAYTLSVNGQASCTTTQLSTGARSFMATYSGTTTYLGSESAPGLLTVTGAANAIACTVTGSADDGSAGTLRPLLAQLDPACGSVTFDISGQPAPFIQLSAEPLYVGSSEISGYMSQTVAIDGGGSVTIDGDGLPADFWVWPGSSLTLRGLTLQDAGTAIDNAGTLDVESAVLTGNGSYYSYGGALYNHGDLGPAQATVANSTLSFNAAYVGGAIANYGLDGTAVVNLSGSTVTGNVAQEGLGGGIANLGYYGTAIVTVSNSTVSGNSAPDGYGGGIANGGFYSAAKMTVSNSTLSGNSAGVGGAADNDGAFGSAALTIANSTLSGDNAEYGNGLTNEPDGGTVSLALRSTILADSAAGECWLDSSSLLDDGHNLALSQANSCSLSTTGSNQFGHPGLSAGGPYDNGGPTATIALVTGSIAIGHGDCAADTGPASLAPYPAVATDQRGAGYLRGSPCDIGAFELQISDSTGWVWRNPKPQGNTLDDVSCVNSNDCIAVGWDGVIQATTDGGSTWSVRASGTGWSLNGITCPSTSACFAVGDAGAIVVSSDGGSTWSPQTTPTTEALYGISCPSTSVCFAVGDGGTILATTDGGSTWSLQVSNTIDMLRNISCPSSSTCFLVGNQQYLAFVLATTDGGTTWNYQGGVSGPSPYLTAISCPSTTVCYAVGENGLMIGTTTGGTGSSPWGFLPSNTDSSLWGVTCTGVSTCFAVGDYGTIMSTANGGGSPWVSEASGTGDYLMGISCPSSTACVAAGFGGTIVATRNSPGNWSLYAPSGPAGWLEAITCVSSSACYAVGDGGAILATTNGGSTWIAQNSAITNDLYGISCPSSTACFAVGANSILTTTNGGSTWSPPYTVAGDYLYGIGCLNSSNCFAVGWDSNTGNGIILTTTTGGNTWSPPYTVADASLNSISCPGNGTCFVAGSAGGSPENGIILTTTNSGNTWSPPYTVAGDYLYGVSCPTSTNCFAAGDAGTVVATTDGGSHWTHQASPTWEPLIAVSCTSASVCFAVGEDGLYYTSGLIMRTTDGGSTWQIWGPTAWGLDAISCSSSSACFAAGGGGTILAENTPVVSSVYSVQRGWNLLSLPLAPTTPISASTLLAGLLTQTGGSYAEIDGFTNGAWTPSYFQEVRPTPLTGGSDYALALGQGYALYSDMSGTITFSGVPAAAQTVSLARGWNLVGFPDAYGSANPAHASAIVSGLLGQTGGNYSELDGFTGGAWTPSYFQEVRPTPLTGGSDYTLAPGLGYALYTDASAPSIVLRGGN